MYLIIKGRNEAVKSLQLDADRSTWLIGRESACDIVLNSSQISRRHAKIICEGEQYFIEDCGSTLGTFIGNAKINDRESISAGHPIRIGSYELLLSPTETVEEAEEGDHTSYTQVDAALRGNVMQGKLLHEYKNANLLYTDEMMATLLLPAGITSLACIFYKDEAELLDSAEDADRIYIEEILPGKMYYNLKAVKEFSFLNDIKTMIMTVFAVLGKEYKEDTNYGGVFTAGAPHK